MVPTLERGTSNESRMRCWQPTGKESKCAQIEMRDGGICGEGAQWAPGRGAGRQRAASCAGFRCGRGVCGAEFWPVVESRGHARPPECVSDRRRAASKPRTRVTRYLCIHDGAKSPENALERLRAIGCRVRLRSRTRHPSRTAHPGPDPAHHWHHRTNPPGAGPSAVVRHEPHQARYAADELPIQEVSHG